MNKSKTAAFLNRIDDDAWWSRASLILGRQYLLTQRLSCDSFFAEDRFLSQTVVVTRLRSRSSLRDKQFLRALRSLATIRHPNFLNVMNVLCAGPIALFITESPQGPSIAEISEKRRFDLDDVQRLMPLSGFDFAAEHILHPGTVSWRSLYIETIGEEGQTSDFKRRPISAWSPFVVKLDVWEIARPQHQFYLSFLPEPKRDPTRWAVRQTALLTCELLGVSRKARRSSNDPPSSLYALDEDSSAFLFKAARGTAFLESGESLFYALESRAHPHPVRQSLQGFLAPQEKIVFAFLTNCKSLLMNAKQASQPFTDAIKRSKPKQILLPFNSVSSMFRRIPVGVSRFIVLSALGASMIWLFLPPQKRHHIALGNNRVEAASVSVPLETARATEAVHEPDSLTDQQSSSIAASSPGEYPANSPSEKSNPDEKKSADLARSNQHKSPASSSVRHESSNYGKAPLARSSYRTSLRRGIANFKIRLISLWRRIGL
jgi:hypothetical protein